MELGSLGMAVIAAGSVEDSDSLGMAGDPAFVPFEGPNGALDSGIYPPESGLGCAAPATVAMKFLGVSVHSRQEPVDRRY